LINFSGKSIGESNEFNIEIDGDNELKKLILEGSYDGKDFLKINSIPFENKKGTQLIKYSIPDIQYKFYRLNIENIYGAISYSPIVKLINTTQNLELKVFPNPFQDYVNLQHYSPNEDLLIACLLSMNGAVIKEEEFKLSRGFNDFKLSTVGLSKGTYILSLKKTSSPTIQFCNIVKQ
jgi:hypothetical protein